MSASKRATYRADEFTSKASNSSALLADRGVAGCGTRSMYLNTPRSVPRRRLALHPSTWLAHEKRKSRAGFTLVELTVALTITAILAVGLIAGITNFLVLISRNNASVDMAADSQNLLRSTVQAIRTGDGVRQTNTISDPNAPAGGWNTSNANFVIVIATPAVDSSHNYIIDPSTASPYMNELVYYKDSDDNLMRRTLANPSATGNSLQTSCPASLATPSCPADAHLASHVKDMTFTLYDQDSNETTDPLQARSIKIDLVLSQPNFDPPITLSDSIRVTLRNRF